MEDGEKAKKQTKRQQKAEERKKQKARSDELISALNLVFKKGNSLITKPEKTKDGALNKKDLIRLQTEFVQELRSEFDYLHKEKPAPAPTNRNNSYPMPLYFKQEFVEWILDPKTDLGKKGVVAKINGANPIEDDPIDYKGQHLGEVLTASADEASTISIDNKDVGISGLASKQIVNALLNYYLVAKKLKGVPIKDKDGNEKVKYNYWRLDDNLKKHFGHHLKELAEKAKEKDPNVSENCMALGAIMSLLAKLTDTERNRSVGKEVLHSPDLVKIIEVDNELVNSLYSHAKATTK